MTSPYQFGHVRRNGEERIARGPGIRYDRRPPVRFMARPQLRSLALFLSALSVVAVGAGCRSKQPGAPPMATPSLKLSRDRAALGSPVEITYRFAVAADAKFAQDYKVMVHVLDSDQELIWTDDH